MDTASPEPQRDSQAAAPTPPPQPRFTPSWKTSAPFGASLGFTASQQSTASANSRDPPATSSFSFSRFRPEEASDPKPVPAESEEAQPSVNSHSQQPVQPAAQPQAHMFTHQPAAPQAAGISFPFFVANRPMDSRIPEACATSFMGIDLSSSPPKPAAAASAVPSTSFGFQPMGGFQSHAVPATDASQNGASSASAASFTFGAGANDPNGNSKPAQDTSAQAGATAPTAASFSFTADATAAAAASFSFTAGATQQAPQSPKPFTPGTRRGKHAGSKSPFSRPIHDGVQLAGNMQDQLNLSGQVASQPHAATQGAEPVVDLTGSCQQPAPTAASAQPAGAPEPAVSNAPSQSGQPEFVFGAGKSTATSFASKAGRSRSNSSSQAQPLRPFIFGAPASAPSAGASAAAFAFAPQHQQVPKGSQHHWPPQAVAPPPNRFGAPCATAVPQPGNTASAHATAVPAFGTAGVQPAAAGIPVQQPVQTLGMFGHQAKSHQRIRLAPTWC